MTGLESSQITELSDELEKLTTQEVREVIQDFGDEESLRSPDSKKGRIRGHIRESEGKKRVDVVSTYVNKLYPEDQRLKRMNNILSSSGYKLDFVGDEIKLIKSRTEGQKERQEEHKNYIEKNAPSDTVKNLKNARHHFLKEEYEIVCSQLRKSLENLTNGDYNNALDELVSEGLIQDSNDNRSTLDREILYMSYAYNSTIGSHDSAKDPKPYKEQSEFSLVLTEETIYFILQKISEANRKGVNLERWTN